MSAQEQEFVSPFEDPRLFSLPPAEEDVLEVRKRVGELADVIGTFPLTKDQADQIKPGQVLGGSFFVDVAGVQWLNGKLTLIGYARDVELG